MPIKLSDVSTLDLSQVSDTGIRYLRAQIEKEFTKRQIKFDVGEIGETLAIDFFKNTPGLDNLQRAPIGTKNVDALSRRGERYSIKTIKKGGKSGTIYPDGEKQLFEYLLLVLLDDDFELKAIYRFSWEKFWEVKKWDKTMNAWYLSKSTITLLQGEKIF